MTVKKKIQISSILLIMQFLFVGAAQLFEYQHLSRKAAIMDQVDKQSVYLQMLLRGLNEVILNEGTPDSLHLTKNALKGFDSIHSDLLATIESPDMRKRVTDYIDPKWRDIKKGIEPFLKDQYLDLDFFDDKVKIAYGALITDTEQIIGEIDRHAAYMNKEFMHQSRKIRYGIILIFFIMLVLTSICLFKFYKSITYTIEELVDIAEGFNRGDLSKMMDESRQDEFGSLARHFNKSTAKLNMTTQQLQERSQELKDTILKLQSEITERKSAEERASHMAFHDSLTGLPNRYLFHDRLSMSIAATDRLQCKIAVLFIDIDDFKRINDSFGHASGDMLLKEVAGQLNHCIRATDSIGRQAVYDTVARLGGDEFTVLLTNIQSSHDAVKVAQRLMKAVSHPFKLDENEVFITLSIGIAICPDDGKDADFILKNADTAMYHAKSHGRNNFQFYKGFMNEIVRKRLLIENDLRKAIDENEMMLYYQPKVDPRTGTIISMEALARWEQPDRGMVSPSEFIPVAEDSGLIIPIGTWVLKTACEQNKSWQKSGLPSISIAVNISARQFQHKDFLKTISDTLKESYLEPRYLELEITESILLHDAAKTISMLNELKNMGVQLAIDDFGTGYSSFNYLIRFPLDIIKIDMSFIKDISEKLEHAAIVNAIISMAHSLGLKVVAEGVETKEQLDVLRQFDCDEIQGFYYSPPLPGKEFTDLLKKTMYQPFVAAYIKNGS